MREVHATIAHFIQTRLGQVVVQVGCRVELQQVKAGLFFAPPHTTNTNIDEI